MPQTDSFEPLAIPTPSTFIENGSYAPVPEKEDDGVVIGHAAQTIDADPTTLYATWHDLSFIPRWQEHVVSVTATSDKVSHWVMGNPEDPDGKRIEYDSEIVEDVPGRRIAWRSIAGDVRQSGLVTFAPAANGRGTLVTLIQKMKVPGGSLGNFAAGVAKRSPRQTVIENLRHFKEYAESGEIPSVAGQPHGPRGISGGIKEWMYGETNPTPPGTSDQA